MTETAAVDSPEVDYSDDISADISKAFDEAEAKNAPPEPKADATLDDRARDEQGRFAKREQPAPDPKVISPAAAPAVTARKFPTAWPKDLEAKWGALDPDVQALIERREADQHKFVTSTGEDVKFAKSLRSMMHPYEQTYKSLGLEPSHVVQSMLEVDRVMRYGTPQEKMQYARDFAEQYGIDIAQLSNTPATPPQYLQMQQQIQQLQSQIQQQEQARFQSIEGDIQQELEAFSTDPANSHFETVRADMAKLVSAGAADSLKDAYEKACWANPQVRASLMAEQQSKADAERKAEEAKRVSEARKRATSITGSPGLTRAPSNTSAATSIEDDVRAAFAEIEGRL